MMASRSAAGDRGGSVTRPTKSARPSRMPAVRSTGPLPRSKRTDPWSPRTSSAVKPSRSSWSTVRTLGSVVSTGNLTVVVPPTTPAPSVTRRERPPGPPVRRATSTRTLSAPGCVGAARGENTTGAPPRTLRRAPAATSSTPPIVTRPPGRPVRERSGSSTVLPSSLTIWRRTSSVIPRRASGPVGRSRRRKPASNTVLGSRVASSFPARVNGSVRCGSRPRTGPANPNRSTGSRPVTCRRVSPSPTRRPRRPRSSLRLAASTSPACSHASCTKSSCRRRTTLAPAPAAARLAGCRLS